MEKNIFKQVLVCLVLFLLVKAAWAALEPARSPLYSINVQGRIFGRGIPVYGDATKDITFRIYDSESEGEVLWEGTVSVLITNGFFNAILGTTARPENPIDIEWDPAKRHYLGVQVAGESDEMSPRKELVAVPFAMLSKKALKVQTVNRLAEGGRVNAVATGIGDDIPGFFKATAPGWWPKAVYAKAEGIGVEGNAIGNGGIGVWGKAYQKGDGVQGENFYDGSAENEKALGVRGISKRGIGVRGETEAENRAGVYGIGRPGVTGVYKDETNYVGEMGGSRPSTRPFITGGWPPTWPVTLETYGVLGQKNADTYGALGHKVIGHLIPAACGVYGYTNSGDAAIKGTNIEGWSHSSTKAGVKCFNYGGGPALEVGRGRVKIASGAAVMTTAGDADDINQPSGIVTIGPGATRSWCTVRNDLVKAGSIVILRAQTGQHGWSYGVKDIVDGSFKVYNEIEGDLVFLVINQ